MPVSDIFVTAPTMAEIERGVVPRSDPTRSKARSCAGGSKTTFCQRSQTEAAIRPTRVGSWLPTESQSTLRSTMH